MPDVPDLPERPRDDKLLQPTGKVHVGWTEVEYVTVDVLMGNERMPVTISAIRRQPDGTVECELQHEDTGRMPRTRTLQELQEINPGLALAPGVFAPSTPERQPLVTRRRAIVAGLSLVAGGVAVAIYALTRKKGPYQNLTPEMRAECERRGVVFSGEWIQTRDGYGFPIAGMATPPTFFWKGDAIGIQWDDVHGGTHLYLVHPNGSISTDIPEKYRIP